MVIITQIQLSRSFFSHILITIIIDVIFHHYPHFDLLRHCQRFLPISGSCHANKEEMKKLAEQLFQSSFFAEDVKPSTVCRKRIGTCINDSTHNISLIQMFTMGFIYLL